MNASLVAWDTETKLIRAGRLAPEMICSTWAIQVGDEPVGSISTTGDPQLDGLLRTMVAEAAAGNNKLVTANGAFDLSVLAARHPDLLPAIFAALERGAVEDVLIREKLLDLASNGDLSFLRLPDGTAQPRDYSLAGLEWLYLGHDRKAEKTDEDAWREHYVALDGVPSADWPERAKQYAIDDAIGTLLVRNKQHERALGMGFADGVIPTEHFQVGVDFCLRLIACWGMFCDLEKKEEIVKLLKEELKPERMKHLLACGILVPKGERYETFPKKHTKTCEALRKPLREAAKAVGERAKYPPCDCPKVMRMVRATKEKITRRKLVQLVETVCTENGIPIKKKDPTEKALEAAEELGEDAEDVEGNTSTDKSVLEEIAHLDPALEEYRYRQYLSKLVNTELPRMSGPVIYTRYDVLKESGRTSSSASDEIPSANVQNVSAVKTLKDENGEPTGQVNIRECFIPRPVRDPALIARGVVRRIVSIDYAALEFCAMAQVCYTLFGFSVMRDLINAGRDPHAYLGAQIALHQDPHFALACQEKEIVDDALAVYDYFKSLEHSKVPEEAALYKQFRKLAKPVGFGFPGGLGIKKFCAFAKAHPYYVKVTEEQAKTLKEIWMRTFPEMRNYFKWVEKQESDGYYSYETPYLGMIRAGCTYTEMCNGRLLQSPAAEGAKLAIWQVVRACYDATRNSILYGQRVLAFIHDELLFELLGTRQEIHDAAHEAARLMVEAMSKVMPDVKITAKPASMLRWSKDAEPVYDANGILDDWIPKQFVPSKKKAS